MPSFLPLGKADKIDNSSRNFALYRGFKQALMPMGPSWQLEATPKHQQSCIFKKNNHFGKHFLYN
jgi:hypothetical protein